jgi:hypothetical protein
MQDDVRASLRDDGPQIVDCSTVKSKLVRPLGYGLANNRHAARLRGQRNGQVCSSLPFQLLALCSSTRLANPST